MAEKKRSLMKVFVILAVVQVILVFISGSFNKKIAIGSEDGKFIIRHVAVEYDLQERINQQFQIDEYIRRAAIIKQAHILEKDEFLTILRQHEHPILANLWSFLSPELQEKIVNKNTFDEKDWALIIHDLVRITNKEILYQPQFDSFLRASIQTSTLEYEDLIRSYEKESLTERERLRLNRLILDTTIPNRILEPQSVTPQICGSYSLYRVFLGFIGESNAIGAFQLIRMILLLDILLLLVAFLTKRLLFDRPSKPQLIFEMLYDLFHTLYFYDFHFCLDL